MRDFLVDANISVLADVAEGATALPTLVLRTLIKRYNAIARRGLDFLRPHPLRHIHRAKAGLEHPPNPHRKPSRPHPRPRRLTDGLGVTVFSGTGNFFARNRETIRRHQ